MTSDQHDPRDPDPNDLVEGRALAESRSLAALPPGDHECDECGGTGRVSEPIVHEGKFRYRMERGWRKRWIIIELAKGELSIRQLAAAVGVHKSSIQDFTKRHAAEIQDTKAKLEEEFVGLWVASKANRLAEIQQDIDDANEIISEEMGSRGQPLQSDPLDPGANDEEDPMVSVAPVWVGLKQRALRAAAEELGQIPNRVRMDLGGSVVTYRIESEPGQPPVDLDQV